MAEGKVYPRSSCGACGATIISGFPEKCAFPKATQNRTSGLAPEMAVYTDEDGLEAAGSWTPFEGSAQYVRADRIAALEAALATARNDALEKAAWKAETLPGWRDSEASPDRIAAAIRALKDQPSPAAEDKP